ncbi:MAG: S4 domain-containing protein, partial [Muribaculaceae bacterium]|nr:S4 domain-containing protein [Muribaculaceae bacterium]
ADISADDFKEGKIDIVTLLVKSGLVSSRNEGRRAVEQGGVSVNKEKVGDISASYTSEDFSSEFILQRGKKNFRKITLV